MYEIKNLSKSTRQQTPRTYISCQSMFIILATTMLMLIYVADTAPVQNEGQAENNLPKQTIYFKAKQDLFATDSRSKRYATIGSIWPNKALTYKISKYTQKLRREDIDAVMAKAFQMWSDHADLTFSAKETGPADIELQFIGSDDPSYHNIFRFDGPGGILGTSRLPNSGGGIYFDDSEDWTINSPRGESLLYAATHQIGHFLGLGHSNIYSAVMSPIMPPYTSDLKLDSDDIWGIEALYGKKTDPSNASK